MEICMYYSFQPNKNRYLKTRNQDIRFSDRYPRMKSSTQNRYVQDRTDFDHPRPERTDPRPTLTIPNRPIPWVSPIKPWSLTYDLMILVTLKGYYFYGIACLERQ